MPETVSAFTFCLLLSASAVLGMKMRGWLSEENLPERTMEALRLVTSLLVTFAALVLSLQLSNVKASFDKAYRDRSADAAQLAQLDECLRNYGPEADPTRLALRTYTAAVIASTWPREPKPVGMVLPDTSAMAREGADPSLGALLNGIGRAISGLPSTDTLRANIAAECRSAYLQLQQRRWAVIEDVHGPISPLFTSVVTFWLMPVFLSFGIQTPRKRVAAIVLAIGVISISTVMFVISDLETHYDGLFGIPSLAMRDALAAMAR
ncbi:bestrophin-like domain [Bosea sp. TAF32]|uniref:bestrophin-like domain n=1 Tax=Bosea sp. TAF32 TaxID=3237482 RepID=UPI003F928B72